jgi:hypothetical protein
MLRKAAGALVLLFIAVWIYQSPSHAGTSVHHAVTAIFAFMHHVS